MLPPPKPQTVAGISTSPSGSCMGSSACPGNHFGVPPTRKGWQGPAVVAQSYTWSHGSVPAAPQGMLSSHRTPSSAPGRAALSPGTLVPRSWSSLNKPGLFAQQPQQRWPRARSRPSQSPARSPRSRGKEKGLLGAVGQRGEDLSVQTSESTVGVYWVPHGMYLPTLTGLQEQPHP